MSALSLLRRTSLLAGQLANLHCRGIHHHEGSLPKLWLLDVLPSSDLNAVPPKWQDVIEWLSDSTPGFWSQLHHFLDGPFTKLLNLSKSHFSSL